MVQLGSDALADIQGNSASDTAVQNNLLTQTYSVTIQNLTTNNCLPACYDSPTRPLALLFDFQSAHSRHRRESKSAPKPSPQEPHRNPIIQRQPSLVSQPSLGSNSGSILALICPFCQVAASALKLCGWIKRLLRSMWFALSHPV